MNRMKDETMLAKFAVGTSTSSLAGAQTEADLALLADQLLAIAQELRSSKQGNARERGARPANAPTTLHLSSQPVSRTVAAIGQMSKLDRAKAAYANRRSRTEIFGQEDLFGEPAWDILLDLFIAHIEDKSVSVSSACIGSAAPPTTGLRWLGVLAENDLILREHDPEDQRRVLVRLTDGGVAAMEEYFARAGQAD